MSPTQSVCASLVVLACAWSPPEREVRAQEPARAGFDQAHTLWTEVLKANVKGDRFDYKALLENRGKLDQYLGELQSVTRDEFERWTKEQRCAFWINAYNAYTVHLVIKNYPLESIKDVGGLLRSVWDKSFIPLGQLFPGEEKKELSLNNIEHDVLRPKFKDARIHAAINCASRSCPPLRAEAFVADRLDAQLDEQVRAWLGDATRNRFERDKKRIQISQIFQWFHEDFERDKGSVRAWVETYAPAKEAEWLKLEKNVDVSYLDYSWKLNDIDRPKR
jgi:hypothetical protein